MEDRERQLEIEGARRSRVALLAIAAGLLYLLGQVLIEILIASKQPTTGLLQGVAPALEFGQRAAAVDPRIASERFLDHHAIAIVLGTAISALALIALAWPLTYLFDAAAARGAPSSPVTRALSRYAGPVAAVVSVFSAIALVVGAHEFVHARVQDTSTFNADTAGGVSIAAGALGFFTIAAVAVIVFLVALRAMRVGLLTRALGIIGTIAGVLFVIPIVPLPVIQALFLVSVGLMLLEKGGLVLPPAWPSGEAIPWVPAPRGGPRGGPRGAPARGSAPQQQRPRRNERSRGALAPVPTPPPSSSASASRKRKRRHR